MLSLCLLLSVFSLDRVRCAMVVVEHWGSLGLVTQELAVAKWKEVTDLESDNFFLKHDRNIVDNSHNYTIDEDSFEWGAVDPFNKSQEIRAKMFDFDRISMNCVRSKCEYTLLHTFHSDLMVCLHLETEDFFSIYWEEDSCNEEEELSNYEDGIEACIKVSNAFAEYCSAFMACFIEGQFGNDVCHSVARHVEDRIALLHCDPNSTQ